MRAKQLKRPRQVTGRTVLWWLVGFFLFIFGANAIMVRAAISTFGGVETQSSYKAGLQFGKEAAAAHRQDGLHWQVSGKLTRSKAGATKLDIVARDAKGLALTGLTANARLAHPADSRLDRDIPVRAIGGGDFHGEAEVNPGQWELIVDFYRGEERAFRSRSRVTLSTP